MNCVGLTPVRPGDVLTVETEILDLRPSRIQAGLRDHSVAQRDYEPRRRDRPDNAGKRDGAKASGIGRKRMDDIQKRADDKAWDEKQDRWSFGRKSQDRGWTKWRGAAGVTWFARVSE